MTGGARATAPPAIALLVVDVQEAAVSPALYAGDEVLGNIARLVERCRDSGVEVVFVQHDGAPGSDYEPGSAGWRLYGSARPEPHEKVVRKSTNSAFRGTDLRAHLDAGGVRTLIVVGLHTEYCFDTTLRVAFEHGYELIVPEMTNTTFDNGGLTGEQIQRHHNERVFRDRFARVPTMDEALALIERGGRVA